MKYLLAAIFATAMSYNAFAKDEFKKPEPAQSAQGQSQAPAKEPLKEPLKEQKAECAVQKDLVDIDQEEMELYQPESAKSKKDIPETVVLRVNTKTGAQSLHYPKQGLVAGNMIADNDVEDIEAWDGSNMETAAAASLVLEQNHSSRWHFNRTRNHNWRHVYNVGHPYYPYYGWNYGPVYSYGRYYDRPYRFTHYRYRPYYSYGLGGHIYRFFRRILD